MDNKCFIELSTKALSKEQMRMAEGICNDLIRQSVTMLPRWCAPDSPEMEQVRRDREGGGGGGGHAGVPRTAPRWSR